MRNYFSITFKLHIFHLRNALVLFILDDQLTFFKHLKMLTPKIDKTIGVLQKLHNLLPISSLITVQYNACLAVTGVIRGTSREKLYQELGLESLQLRLWFRKLCFSARFIKVISLVI